MCRSERWVPIQAAHWNDIEFPIATQVGNRGPTKVAEIQAKVLGICKLETGTGTHARDPRDSVKRKDHVRRKSRTRFLSASRAETSVKLGSVSSQREPDRSAQATSWEIGCWLLRHTHVLSVVAHSEMFCRKILLAVFLIAGHEPSSNRADVVFVQRLNFARIVSQKFAATDAQMT